MSFRIITFDRSYFVFSGDRGHFSYIFVLLSFDTLLMFSFVPLFSKTSLFLCFLKLLYSHLLKGLNYFWHLYVSPSGHLEFVFYELILMWFPVLTSFGHYFNNFNVFFFSPRSYSFCRKNNNLYCFTFLSSPRRNFMTFLFLGQLDVKICIVFMENFWFHFISVEV